MTTRKKQWATEAVDLLSRIRRSQVSPAVAQRPHHRHTLRRALPQALRTLAMLSLARAVGLRRGRRFLSLAAIGYLQERSGRRHQGGR
jgi:hypothetical protein